MSYRDAKRLSGNSYDVVDIPTFSDDFTSYADTTAGDLAYPTSNTAQLRVNPTTDVIDFQTQGVHTISRDFTSISNSDWVLRYKHTYTTAGSESLGILYIFFSTNTSNAQTAHTGLGWFHYDNDNQGGLLTNLNTRPDQSPDSDFQRFNFSPSVSTHWIELKRVGTTTLTINVYNNSDYSGTPLYTKTKSDVSASITGLRYLKFMGYTTGNMVGTIDDVKFYNGISSLTSKPFLSEPNGIFLEIDTGKYLWRDKSKEWIIPIHNAIVMGGNESGTVVSTVQTYNGVAWSTVSSLSTARRRGMGGGSLSDAIVAGGVNSVPTYLSSSEEYNGTSWSAGGSLPAPKSNGGGGGNSSDAFVVRGYTTGDVKVDTTFEYNGTSWSSSGSCSPAAGFIGADGNSTDAIVAGGYSDAPATNYNTTFEYNGTSWNNGGNLSSINQSPSVGGSTTNAICVDGYTGGYTNNTQEYNGTSWSAGGSVSTNRYVGSTRGSTDKALTTGGTVNTTSELYNGTSWSTVGSISTIRHSMGMGGSA